MRLEITDTGADCKFSVGDYVQALSVTNGTGGEVAFAVTPSVESSPVATATAAASRPSATAGPPTVTARNSPPGQGVVPRTAASASSLPAATEGNAAPNPALLGCDGDNTRSAALLAGATPASQGETKSNPLPATAVASLMQVGVLLQPNGVQPAQLQLPLNTTIHVIVSNQGAACRFALGPFLQSIAIPATGSADFTFTGKSTSIATPAPSAGLTAGCLDDATRQMQLLLPGSHSGG